MIKNYDNKHFIVMKNRLIIRNLLLSMVPSRYGLIEYLDTHPKMNNINKIFIFIPRYMDPNVFENILISFKYNIPQKMMLKYTTKNCKLIITCPDKYKRDRLREALKDSIIKNVHFEGGSIAFLLPNQPRYTYF